MKICFNKDCLFVGQLQPLENFYKDKRVENRLRPTCKNCIKRQNKQYSETHKEEKRERSKQYEKTHKEQIKERKKQHYQAHKEEKKQDYLENKEKRLQQFKQYYKTHKEEKREYNKKYNETHKEEIKKYKKQYKLSKLKEDINFKLVCLLRTRLNSAIKGNFKSGSAVRDLGFSIEELKQYFEPKFHVRKTGEQMTWENHGKKGWHIDHIRPLASFDLSDRKQFLQAVHYTNLQPLWAEENLSKGKHRL